MDGSDLCSGRDFYRSPPGCRSPSPSAARARSAADLFCGGMPDGPASNCASVWNRSARLLGLDLRGSRGIVAGSGAARPFVADADADADRAPAPDSGRGMGMIFETRSGNLLEKITPGAHGAGQEWGFSSGVKIEKVYRGISIGCTPCKAWLGRACARTSSAATLGRSIGAGSVVF